MEDEIRVKVEQVEESAKTTHFLGVFDGYEGGQASVYARSFLFKKIRQQPGFYEDDPANLKMELVKAL